MGSQAATLPHAVVPKSLGLGLQSQLLTCCLPSRGARCPTQSQTIAMLPLLTVRDQVLQKGWQILRAGAVCGDPGQAPRGQALQALRGPLRELQHALLHKHCVADLRKVQA